VLMAMAWVRLQAVKRVPSRTFLPGAHVILILLGVSRSRRSRAEQGRRTANPQPYCISSGHRQRHLGLIRRRLSGWESQPFPPCYCACYPPWQSCSGLFRWLTRVCGGVVSAGWLHSTSSASRTLLAKDRTPETHTSSEQAMQRNDKKEIPAARARPNR
jgi:hypothetical protein